MRQSTARWLDSLSSDVSQSRVAHLAQTGDWGHRLTSLSLRSDLLLPCPNQCELSGTMFSLEAFVSADIFHEGRNLSRS